MGRLDVVDIVGQKRYIMAGFARCGGDWFRPSRWCPLNVGGRARTTAARAGSQRLYGYSIVATVTGGPMQQSPKSHKISWGFGGSASSFIKNNQKILAFTQKQRIFSTISVTFYRNRANMAISHKFLKGREPKYSDPDIMTAKIEEYFDRCYTRNDIPTVPDLAYHLGFASRQSLYDYKEKPRFAYSITRAILKMEGRTVKTLLDPDTKNTRGPEFVLKNNFGYVDSQKIEQTGTIDVLRIALPEAKPIGAPVSFADRVEDRRVDAKT